jgi:hypothetical protein
MRRVLAGGFGLFASAAAGATPVPQAQWPAEVRAAHQINVEGCREQGGRLAIEGADYVVTGDFNGDGRPDYLVDSNYLQCSTATGYYCGSAGCGVDVLLSRPDGRLEEATGILSFQVVVSREGGRDYVTSASRHGEVTFGWNGREFTTMTAAQRRAMASARPRQPARPAQPPIQARGSGETEQLGAAGNWIVARSPQGNLFAHSMRGAGGVETLGLTCVGGQPHLMTLLPGYRGRSATVALGAGAGRVEAVLRPQGSGWISTVGDPRLAALIGGDASEVEVSLNGRAVGRVSLAGSSRALGEALAACWRPAARPASRPAITALGPEEAELRAQVNALFAIGNATPRFTPSLERIFTRYEAEAISDTWGNWMCACQDVQRPRVEVRSIRVEGNRAEVQATYSDFGQSHPRRLIFVRQGGRWLLDDAFDAEGSIRTALALP